MNALRRYILSIILLLSCLTNANAWGKKGHNIIAYIAECHLTPAACAKVDTLLSGYSMVYWSAWADSARYTKEYSYTKPWHYRNIEEGKTPQDTPTPKGGDVVYATERMTSELRDTTLSSEQHTLALKLLIHFVGDLHCPMHAGRLSDRGGNRLPMVFFYRSTNLHTIWDTQLIEQIQAWSYTEWQREIDRKSERQQQKITDGTPTTWFAETHAIAEMIYRDARTETDISYDYVDKYQSILESQLLNAGLRLAHILNEIYK